MKIQRWRRNKVVKLENRRRRIWRRRRQLGLRLPPDLGCSQTESPPLQPTRVLLTAFYLYLNFLFSFSSPSPSRNPLCSLSLSLFKNSNLHLLSGGILPCDSRIYLQYSNSVSYVCGAFDSPKFFLSSLHFFLSNLGFSLFVW